ncbi:MAG: hypothetical protein J5507_03405 [Clostridia bacterium]|nr:hypothetical protein [Clostridia bacterium]
MEKEKRKEDTTKYGEFVPTTHHWLPIEQQKKKAEKLANITKENDQDRN